MDNKSALVECGTVAVLCVVTAWPIVSVLLTGGRRVWSPELAGWCGTVCVSRYSLAARVQRRLPAGCEAAVVQPPYDDNGRLPRRSYGVTASYQGGGAERF